MRPVWYSKNMLEYTVAQHIDALADTIKLCLANPTATLEGSLRPTTSDLSRLWTLNHRLPPSYDFCMHDVISERGSRAPNKVAIDSWDGQLTYGQIEQWSTHIAHELKNKGVMLHDVVPICFEKSKWTIVAVLAVMKVGATMAMMDPSLPLARLQNMGVQIGAKTMVCSRKQLEFGQQVLPEGQFVIVEQETFASLSDSIILPALPVVPADALMYIIFTSGSTGTPKGVQISHKTYTSSAFPRAAAVGYNEASRVLDFASYAFDVSIDSMLLTLGNGGCLCIPSDEDRMNDINTVMRDMKVNYAGITPSVARILDADIISSLSALGLGGEAASAIDVNRWGKETRIVIGYGPCECTIGCTVNSSAATGRDWINIGPGNGAAMWIVDPNDDSVLMPVGAVGELCVEGPIVGQGYLNDPEKTASVFIEDPAWLVAGHGDFKGRKGRMYKTGDLGRYDPDGSGGIVFAGRKDTQVKLRGQRVELGEIESQLRARLASETNVIAEVIVPQGAGGHPTLVAFVAAQTTKGIDTSDIVAAELPAELQAALTEANKGIAKVLPRYMVPTVYIPVNYIPALISGKTDRKRLRAYGATVDLRQLDQGEKVDDRDLTDLETRLRVAWAETLKVEADMIRLEDNFFALGGDSLAAMRLASIARDHGLEVTVANTFGHPSLVAMARVAKTCDAQTRTETKPFSMIKQDVSSACKEAAETYGLVEAAIEDIYPCTPTQESLFTFSLKSVKAYVAQRVALIPDEIEVDAWKAAWEEVVLSHPILRTRLAQITEPGLQQVILKSSIEWKTADDLAAYLEEDKSLKMNLGENLARYAIVHNGPKRYMVWTVHHVLYDGWSEPVILSKVRNALQKQVASSGHQSHMHDFVRFVQDTDVDAMHEFWRTELAGAVGPQFPRLPSRDFLPIPDGFVEHHIPLESLSGSQFTLATLIRGAWALVASQYTASDDVVFGETLTGRDIALPGVEGIVGPMIATVPVRIAVRRTATVNEYLDTIQKSMLARTPFQHMGMQNIRKVSSDAQHACEAGTGLVIQPEPEYDGTELGFEVGDVVREALHFNPYPLMIACGIRKGGFRICASFDTRLVQPEQMTRILRQVEVTLGELRSGLEKRVGEVSCLTAEELERIWQWNSIAPLGFDEASKRVRADPSTIKQGDVYPPAVVPWVCDQRNPDLLAPIGCVGELWLEGSFFPGETPPAPSWLQAGCAAVPGRQGKLHRTGDLVFLKEDSSLVFVGRKENVVSVQGHDVDVADLEAHFGKYLPAGTKAFAAVSQGEENSLVVFVEAGEEATDALEVLSEKKEISCEAFGATVGSEVSIELAASLKKLDKFIRDALPPYMAPSAYIVVDKVPTGPETHSHLNKLASSIPTDLLAQLRQGFASAFSQVSAKASLSPSEDILRSAWAKILDLNAAEIDVDDNFFRLGGDSVLAMKLVSRLRTQGHSLSVADIFQHMRLGDAAAVLKIGSAETVVPIEAYSPFSTMKCADLESFLVDVVRPQLGSQDWVVQDVLPVTDSQTLDVRATVQPPRTSIQYTLMYFDKTIDQTKLFGACGELVKMHEILRTVFVEHEGVFLQVVVKNLEVGVAKIQADKDLETYVKEICAEDIKAEWKLGCSFLRLFYVEGEDKDCLVIGLSHALYDGMSLPNALRDLESLYAGKQVSDIVPFSTYISRIQSSALQSSAVTYWSDLLTSSALSVLPNQTYQIGDKAIFRTKDLANLTLPLPLEEITTATLLTTSWALVLARQLQSQDVVFGTVTSGRILDMPNVENAMGPCYAITPVRVSFSSQTWTAMDLLRSIQTQTATSAVHDFLGFKAIAEKCTSWSGTGEKFFDSMTHHQDFEDFDTMPFGDGECRVDIANPDGDAAVPIKAVSFMKKGVLTVGVVGSERDEVLVDGVLESLAGIVEELVAGRDQVVKV